LPRYTLSLRDALPISDQRVDLLGQVSGHLAVVRNRLHDRRQIGVQVVEVAVSVPVEFHPEVDPAGARLERITQSVCDVVSGWKLHYLSSSRNEAVTRG